MSTRTTPHPPDVEAWLAALPPHQRDQAEWLAARVHAAAPDIAEAVKWKRLTFTVDDNWHHWLCAVAATKKQVALTFHKGSLLADPDGLLGGTSQYTRQVGHDDARAAPAAVVALVGEAIAHQTDMIG